MRIIIPQNLKPPGGVDVGVDGVRPWRQIAHGAISKRTAAVFTTGLTHLDALAPGKSFACGGIHEVLSDPGEGLARFFAVLLAQAAAREAGAIVWCEGAEQSPSRRRAEIYPPALAAGGMPMDRLFLLRPKSVRDEVWAVGECLRCKGVRATVAAPGYLSRVEARRLQLAAEHGGGIGILMRPHDKTSMHYAAVTRWLIRPARGEGEVQRWEARLIHGHGGRVGQAIILEVCRDSRFGFSSINRIGGRPANYVRALEPVVDRSSSSAPARASA